jgi:hypothetical protein
MKEFFEFFEKRKPYPTGEKRKPYPNEFFEKRKPYPTGT